MRVVSLLPSSTEIVCALGCRDLLVGRSHECDHPPGVEELPACTAPKFDPDGTSYQVDQRVKAILQEAASVYRVDADLLDELAPDWLVTQSQCEVCAVSLKEVEEAACRLVRSRPSILSLEPNRLEDLWDDIGRVAAALEVEERGRALVAGLRERLDRLAARTRPLDDARASPASSGSSRSWPPATGSPSWWKPPAAAASSARRGSTPRGCPGRPWRRRSPTSSCSCPAASTSPARGGSCRRSPGSRRGPACGPCARGGSSSPTATSSSTARGRGWWSRRRSSPRSSIRGEFEGAREHRGWERWRGGL